MSTGGRYWLSLPLVLLATGVGIIIVTQSVRGQGSTAESNPTPTRTVEETARLSASIQATQTVIKGNFLQDLIDRHESVAGSPRSDSTGERLDPPPAFDEAVSKAERVVIGRVVDQHLEWGIREPFGFRAPVLVSTIVDEKGTEFRVAQPVDLGERPDIGGIRLVYSGGEQLMSAGETYALLATADTVVPDRLELIRGQLYSVQPDGALRAAQSVTMMGGAPASVVDLETRFNAAKAVDTPN